MMVQSNLRRTWYVPAVENYVSDPQNHISSNSTITRQTTNDDHHDVDPSPYPSLLINYTNLSSHPTSQGTSLSPLVVDLVSRPRSRPEHCTSIERSRGRFFVVTVNQCHETINHRNKKQPQHRLLCLLWPSLVPSKLQQQLVSGLSIAWIGRRFSAPLQFSLVCGLVCLPINHHHHKNQSDNAFVTISHLKGNH